MRIWSHNLRGHIVLFYVVTSIAFIVTLAMLIKGEILRICLFGCPCHQNLFKSNLDQKFQAEDNIYRIFIYAFSFSRIFEKIEGQLAG